MFARMLVAVVLSFALLVAPVCAEEKASAWGNLEAQGRIEVNGAPVPSETTLFVGDRVSTKEKGLATVTLAGGNQVFVIENSAAYFQADAKSVTLERGAIGVLHRGGEGVLVSSRRALVRPAKGTTARFVVKLENKGFLLSSLAGDVDVVATNRTVTVPLGKTMRIELGEPPQDPVGSGAGHASAYAAQTVFLVSAIIVGVTLAIALPLALKNDEPVSPALP